MTRIAFIFFFFFIQIADSRDYCQFTTFNATCSTSEVVIITEARYGRMTLGHCLSRDYGYIGCFADVSYELDVRCSGRQTCAFSIPDAHLHSLQDCPDDMSVYLEASYTCKPVKTAVVPHRCPAGNVEVTDSRGVLASAYSLATSHGTESCPWSIRVQPGQRINITLVDFSVRPNTEYSVGSFCTAYAIIKEPDHGETICGGEKRERTAYISRNNQVEIRVIRGRDKQHYNYFLLKYEVFGCKQLAAVGGAVVEYNEDRARITCPGGKIWQLQCIENTWTGTYENCSDWKVEPLVASFQRLPAELTVALISGIAFVVVVIILVIGLFCIRKHRLQNRQQVERHAREQRNKSIYSQRTPHPGKSLPPSKQRAYHDPNDYSGIWEAQTQTAFPQHAHYFPTQPYPHNYDGHSVDPYVDQFGRHEHIYESPKFERRGSNPNLPVYYELDTEAHPDDK